MRSALHESLADAIPTYINIGSSNGTLGTVEVRDCVINVASEHVHARPRGLTRYQRVLSLCRYREHKGS